MKEEFANKEGLQLEVFAYQTNDKLYGCNFCIEQLRETYGDKLHDIHYLHGKLDELVGYDIGVSINANSLGLTRQTINWTEKRGNEVTRVSRKSFYTEELYINGIVPVKVHGINEHCVGYFWTIDDYLQYQGVKYPYWKQRGLVVLKSDKEGNEYAKECMRKRETCL